MDRMKYPFLRLLVGNYRYQMAEREGSLVDWGVGRAIYPYWLDSILC